MAKKTSAPPINQALLNVITPMGLQFGKNRLTIGENTARVYGVIKYPQKVDISWLSKITNIPGTVVSITVKPIDNGSLVSAISKSIVQNRGVVESARDPLVRQRAEKAVEDGERIMMQIDQHGETVCMMGIVIMPMAMDEKAFAKTCRQVESSLSVLNCKGRILANVQEDAFKHLSPTFASTEKIFDMVGRISPCSTYYGGFPFSSSGFNDGKGYYWGRGAGGGLVIVDPWRRGGDRTNTNMVITGVPGTGKSTVVKHLAISEYMMGTKLLFIDPESEYKTLCQNLDGTWVNTAGGAKSNGMLNPLQIRPAPQDDDEEEDNNRLFKDEGFGLNDMALHLKTLDIFFKLYISSLTDMQTAILKKAVIDLYKQHKIHWNTDIRKLKNTDFPIMSDLYSLVVQKASENESEPDLGKLALLLYDIAFGSDSFLWNGHTTLNPKSNCICLDTHALQSVGDNIKSTQYFNQLTYCWEEMSKDRGQRVMLICDEAYLMIDQRVPQSLVFLRNISKRARKYEGGLAIVTHSIVDLLASAIRMYGQALLDTPCYKILMGTDGENLKETRELYSLTEAEEELLMSKRRGHGLVMLGSKRLHLNFDIPDWKLDYMGSGGGR